MPKQSTITTNALTLHNQLQAATNLADEYMQKNQELTRHVSKLVDLKSLLEQDRDQAYAELACYRESIARLLAIYPQLRPYWENIFGDCDG